MPAKPSIVFAHGIWADGSCFSKVIPPLAGEGYQVIAAQYGLDTLKSDVAMTRNAIGRVSGPVLLDPGLVLWLEQHEDLSPGAVADALEHRSGLLALAGTADMREVQARAAAGDEAATLAFDVFIHRLVTGIGAMAAAAGGLDALAFTGGIGENSAVVRAAAAERLGHLGVRIDAGRNDETEADADISHEQARARTLVVTAREDLQIAREIRRLLAAGS